MRINIKDEIIGLQVFLKKFAVTIVLGIRDLSFLGAIICIIKFLPHD